MHLGFLVDAQALLAEAGVLDQGIRLDLGAVGFGDGADDGDGPFVGGQQEEGFDRVGVHGRSPLGFGSWNLFQDSVQFLIDQPQLITGVP